MTDKNADGVDRNDTDALGRLIHAAGPRPMPRHEDYQRVLEASRNAWQAKLRTTRRRLWLYGLAALLAVAAVGLIAVVRTTPTPEVAIATIVHGRVEVYVVAVDRWEPLAPGDGIRTGARLRTVADGRAAFRLVGGSTLRVDSATEWTFAPSAHIELVGGTVYVDSGSRGSSKGLQIATAFGVVRDIGTQFEIRALSTSMRLRVREGIVLLQPTDQPSEVQTGAGEQLLIDGDGTIERVAVALDGVEWSWAEALAEPLQIDGRSAFEVLTWVARETGKRLVFEDANAELRARNAILSGSGRDLSPMETLQVVVGTSEGLDYAIVGRVITIRRR